MLWFFKAVTNMIQQHTVCFVPARFYRGTDRKDLTVITGKFPSVSRQIRKGPDPTSASIPEKGIPLSIACASCPGLVPSSLLRNNVHAVL